MNGTTVKRFVAVAAVGLTIFATQAFADSYGQGVPGSTDDPVVTKSYVDQQIQQMQGGGGGGAARLVVEELKPGQTMYGFEGTEFIVRTGQVVSVPGVNGDGLTDLTAGADLRAGAPVEANHLILIARSDSRGLRLAPQYSGVAHVMIRGSYEIK